MTSILQELLRPKLRTIPPEKRTLHGEGSPVAQKLFRRLLQPSQIKSESDNSQQKKENS
jgi:hypothetical protein